MDRLSRGVIRAFTLAGLLSSGAVTASSPEPAPDALAVEGLARVFEVGPFLEDRNGDGQIDWVAARIVLPDSPAPEELAAAAAIAARLGFETSGLSLPLVFRGAEIPESPEGKGARDRMGLILIGTGNRLLPRALAARVNSLAPGQGLVAHVDGAVVVAGKDPAGTRAAAEAFALRSPYLWEVIGRQNGETARRIADDLANYLGRAGVAVSRVSFQEILFEKDRKEAVSAAVAVTVTGGSPAQARAELAALEERHRKGEDTDKLNYSSAAQMIFRLDAPGSSESVTLSRVGLPQRMLTPPREGVAPPGEAGEVEGRREKAAVTFDLSNLFTRSGLLKDTDQDQIPDVTETVLVLPSDPDSLADVPMRGAAHLAARLGLESTGVAFPVAKLDSEIKQPQEERSPLLLGGASRLARDLARVGKRRASEPPPGAGVIEVVPAAFGESPAVVIAGGDREGAEAAADYLARRAPHTWTVGRGETTLEDVEDAVGSLLDGRTVAAQAALALARLEEIVAGLEGKDLESLAVTAYLEEASPDLDRFLLEELSRREKLKAARLEVKSRGRREPVEVFRDQPAFEWEVDAFWKAFRERALPRIPGGAPVSVELRVSESPELRKELAEQVRSEIERAGGRPAEVQVLSAYKQGLSWLVDRVAPALKALPAGAVGQVEVSWKPFPVDISKKWRFFPEPARWLNELYPADEVLARELGLTLETFSFLQREDGESIYTVTARNASGAVLFEDSFSPAYYERPYLDAFPERARVTVTTGWVRVRAGEEILLDERLPTDLDWIWDDYQGRILSRVAEHVKRTTGGKPTQDKQPFFHTLRFELEASEPDYALGIDQELVTSLESIHDDVYFDTLDFLSELVEEAEGKPVPARGLAPGNVLPWIHPERRGQAPKLTIVYSENASRLPKLVVEYQEKGGEKKTETRELAPVMLPRPSTFLAFVRARENRIGRLGLRVDLEKTEPLGRLADLLDNLARLREAGVFPEALGFAGVAEIALRLEAPGATTTRIFTSRGARDARPAPPRHAGGKLVGWDAVVSPEESERIAATLGTLPEVTTFVAGRSYQGRPVSVMEIRLPMEAELVSQAKLSTWKPVLSIMGRQHANEVSSTSHILRLAELLATDPGYRRYLQKMNVVIQPVVNPDGAALAFELSKLNPLHCQHAGRYSALGSDVPVEARKPDTLVTEALVLGKVFNTWLPDVQLNPHGYPTHEWVQTFANYNPYGFRSYWIPRGWWTSIQPVEDPRFSQHREVAFAMRDFIAEEVSRDAEVRAVNLRIYERYRRWTTRWQPHVYSLEVHQDTAIYFTRRSGTAPRADGRASITVFSGFTEAMDETAQGPWLALAARMGFGYLMAAVRFLDECDYTLYRLEEERQGKVRLALTRPRPVKLRRDAASPPGGAIRP